MNVIRNVGSVVCEVPHLKTTHKNIFHSETKVPIVAIHHKLFRGHQLLKQEMKHNLVEPN